MCLIAFALEPESRFRLVLAGNRDEFHDRASLAAHWWGDVNFVFGGRDLVAGGTWLAMSRRGRIAALTNYRDRPVRGPGLRSRGELSAGFLTAAGDAASYQHGIRSSLDSFAGFNLLLFESAAPLARCTYLSNRSESNEPQSLLRGIHGLSNHLLNTPWPKVKRLQSAIDRALDLADPSEVLFEALADQRPVAPEEPDLSAGEAQTLLRTPFIADMRYGTRASTVITVDHAGMVMFCERSWGWRHEAPRLTGERRVRFRLES